MKSVRQLQSLLYVGWFLVVTGCSTTHESVGTDPDAESVGSEVANAAGSSGVSEAGGAYNGGEAGGAYNGGEAGGAYSGDCGATGVDENGNTWAVACANGGASSVGGEVSSGGAFTGVGIAYPDYSVDEVLTDANAYACGSPLDNCDGTVDFFCSQVTYLSVGPGVVNTAPGLSFSLKSTGVGAPVTHYSYPSSYVVNEYDLSCKDGKPSYAFTANNGGESAFELTLDAQGTATAILVDVAGATPTTFVGNIKLVVGPVTTSGKRTTVGTFEMTGVTSGQARLLNGSLFLVTRENDTLCN